jgi:gamma-glutamyl-gamma-aminobutyrate hydrolase PuuD
MRDNILEYPELYMDVYIAGDVMEQRAFAEMFIRSRCRRADTPDEADLVVFTGGPDVDPVLYGELPHPTTRVDLQRDKEDLALYAHCLKHGIPMFGVCRGAQFLAVMMGAKLYQDVDKHYGDHTIWDHKSKVQLGKVSSVHHQMVIPHTDGGMEIIATSGEATYRWKNPTDKIASSSMQDVEAFFYRETCILGVQGHPEYRGYNAFARWTLRLLDEYIVCSPDTVLIDNKRRIQPDLVAQREAKWKEQAKKKAN